MRYQRGGANTKCSLCKSEGTLSSTCPWNPKAILSGKTKPSAHKNALDRKVLSKAKKGLEAMITKLKANGGKDDEIAIIQDIIDNGVAKNAKRKSQKAKPTKPARKSQKAVVCKLNANGRCSKHTSGDPDEECEYNESSKRCKKSSVKKSKAKVKPKQKKREPPKQKVHDSSEDVEEGGGGAKYDDEEEDEEIVSEQAVPKPKQKPKVKPKQKPKVKAKQTPTSSSESPESVHEDRGSQEQSEDPEPVDFVTINVNDIGAELPKIQMMIGDTRHTFKLGLPYPDNSEQQYHNLYRYKNDKTDNNDIDEFNGDLILKGRCVISGSGKRQTLDVQLIAH